jgi:hypothetical protein
MLKTPTSAVETVPARLQFPDGDRIIGVRERRASEALGITKTFDLSGSRTKAP